MPLDVNTTALNASLESAQCTEAPPGVSAEVAVRPTMVKVENVSMVFNMASEQLNSLKEYLISIARRNLFFEELKALDNVSFEVKRGDVFGILGTNGSGKSTMLKIIAGVLEPTEGTCEIHGNIAPLIELGAGFDMDLTARENIYLNGALLGYPRSFIDEHFDDIVAFAEVEKFLDMPMKNYSSGMVARIAFAIATVIVPEILVVDEVLSVGDFMFQKKCEERITQLIERHGVTVLIVSHSNDQIARLCNRAIWIEKGHTRLMGDADLVTRVYGGLGGRTGSAEAEKRIFDLLVQEPLTPKELADTVDFVAGEGSCGASAALVSKGWQPGEAETVVLAANTTHANAVIANSLASAFNAPVLAMDTTEVPDVIARVLHELMPKRIFLVDCGNHAKAVVDQLRKLRWQPEVIVFGNDDGDIENLSFDVFDYGNTHGLWGNQAALVHFADNIQSLAAVPYIYKRRCPVVVIANHSDSENEEISQRLSAGNIQSVVVFGKTVANTITSETFENVRTEFVGSSKENVDESIAEISDYTYDHNKSATTNEVCIAQNSMAVWPYIFASGGYAAKNNTCLQFIDNTSLDSICACISFLENEKNISHITLVGREGDFNHTEQNMLGCSLRASSQKAD